MVNRSVCALNLILAIRRKPPTFRYQFQEALAVSGPLFARNGVITAAAQEERFTRKKHDPGFPTNAIQYCLEEGGISLRDVDLVAFYDKPFLKFERLLETYLTFAPRGFTSFRKALPIWIREKLFQKDLLCKELGRMAPGVRWADRLLFSEHHESHAASGDARNHAVESQEK